VSAIWVGAFFLALQQVEGHVVAPQIFGKTLRINPLLVIFALLFGGEIYGILGALLALPLAAVARETAVYLRGHLVLEPWGTPGSIALDGAGGREADRRCQECGRTVAEGDSFCRACGTPLGSPMVTRG
jgi:hypothetical protein